ncbi:MAD2L1-binding protein [Trichoplax sp. H2]|nr:MAD2L1-binding protein [Trichoplax sp. H2]|eukprot:RDD40884.1 MAD2L1-binding protein [Trichoplax sp. H2]
MMTDAGDVGRSCQDHNQHVQFESQKWDAETKTKLVTGIIQLVLYHRHQIPAPIELLAREKPVVDKDKDDKRGLPNQSAKPLLNLLTALEELSLHLSPIFDSNVIQEMLVLLGPTIFSPKCVYRINFDCREDQIVLNLPFPKPEVISRQLMLKLSTHEDFSMCKSFPVTNLFLFIKLPRYTNIPWLLPRQDFKLRSQIKPFIIDIVLHPDLQKPEKNTADAKVTDKNDMIWFQVPVSIKGYKDKR